MSRKKCEVLEQWSVVVLERWKVAIFGEQRSVGMLEN